MSDTKNLKNPFRNNPTHKTTGSNSTLNTTFKRVVLATNITTNTDYPDCCGIGCSYYNKYDPHEDYDCSLFKTELREEERFLKNATQEILAMYGNKATFSIRCPKCLLADTEIVDM